MKKDVAISVRNMSKRFKLNSDKPHTLKERLVFGKKNKKEYRQILKDINLDIKRGETVALIGTNGSGKSTLLKLMTKIIYPNKGKIETNGKLTSLLELGAGFHPDFTGRENIYFNAAVFGLTKAEIEKRVDDIIEFSELAEFMDVPMKNYSSGMLSRLAFAIATSGSADILIVDEVLAVGDFLFQQKCIDRIKGMMANGTTVLFVSHSIEQVEEICNKAVWIKSGEIFMQGDAKEVCSVYKQS